MIFWSSSLRYWHFLRFVTLNIFLWENSIEKVTIYMSEILTSYSDGQMFKRINFEICETCFRHEFADCIARFLKFPFAILPKKKKKQRSLLIFPKINSRHCQRRQSLLKTLTPSARALAVTWHRSRARNALRRGRNRLSKTEKGTRSRKKREKHGEKEGKKKRERKNPRNVPSLVSYPRAYFVIC